MYRLVNNDRGDWVALFAPHARATAERARAAGTVVVAHDTTQFSFGGRSRADELGYLPHGGVGFFGHFALAVSHDEDRIPLGMSAIELLRREPARKKSET